MATVTKPIALDESFNTTEVTPRNIADVLAEELSRITGRTASEVEYDNTDSGLTSDDVQGAIDELSERPILPSVDIQTAVDEFSTYNGGLLSSCKVSLTPNQDLHGYDNPWVGGAGKNKLPLTLTNLKAINTHSTWSGNVFTSNNVTFTVQTDSVGNVINIKVTGTPTSRALFRIFTSDVGGYLQNIFKGMILNGSNQNFSGNNGIYVAYSNNGTSWADEQFQKSSEVTIKNNDYLRIEIMCDSGTFDNDFKPMIRLATESDPTFAPYSNICPISGHTQVKVGDDGKNRFNPNSYESFDITGGGVIRYGHEFDSGEYTLINNGTGSSGYFYRIVAKDYSSYGTSVQITNNTSVNVTVDNAHFLRVFTASWDDTADKIAIIEGTNETFVPYNGYQVTVNLGGTYYSGTLDVVSGVLTVDKVGVSMNGSESWNTHGAISHGFYCDNVIPSGLLMDSTKDDTAISNEYNQNRYDVATSMDNGKFAYGLTGGTVRRFILRDDRFSTVADLTTALGTTNLQLVMELATPQSIQLSPTMVKALVGENHLSAPLEGQEITESKYRELFTWDEVEEIAQKMADSKIDNLNTSYDTTFSSSFTEARYVKKIYGAPVLTALQIVLSGAPSITFNHQLIFSDSQTCCELIQFGSGPRIGITDVAISQGSVTFTFDSSLTKAIGFRCRITNDFVS